jgi:hypothetical protein
MFTRSNPKAVVSLAGCLALGSPAALAQKADPGAANPTSSPA